MCLNIMNERNPGPVAHLCSERILCEHNNCGRLKSKKSLDVVIFLPPPPILSTKVFFWENSPSCCLQRDGSRRRHKQANTDLGFRAFYVYTYTLRSCSRYPIGVHNPPFERLNQSINHGSAKRHDFRRIVFSPCNLHPRVREEPEFLRIFGKLYFVLLD